MYSPDKMMGSKGPTGLHGPITSTGACFAGRYSPTYRSPEPMARRCMPNPSGDIFSGLNDGLISRAEALAAVDIKHQTSGGPGGLPQLKHDMMYHHSMGAPPVSRPHQTLFLFQMSHMDGLEMLDPISSSSMTTLTPMSDTPSHMHAYGMNHVMNHHHHGGPLSGHNAPGHHGGHHSGHPGAHHPAMAAAAAAAAVAGLHPDADTDPRELEAFAERFKQRRIKLGVTQADVGKALANLKLPGVGALSQSTICRFESLTLSHNNMIALKPILQAWLEEAEAQAKNKRRDPDAPSVLPAGEKKRKRTSIAAPEKRSLEAYFAVQPRPSGEKIAAIAEKLDLKKNVVRVWFCNQRQKQKRMKFAAQH
ncbi:inhibitory POU protein isoform X3 [Aethina tumida]|uniref:inhibitory POU protein isoform X3 n=1 Tax=Aethina tumida TaxID=116153 RepID=UPI0021474E80|nr:inhibitory POU protein isoform X3 [Aethina tumida]